MSGAMNPTGPGDFATSRRGGLTREEIREIEAHRGRPRPTPWQALSERYGRSVSDLKALFAVPEVAVSPPEAWPFGACSFAIQEALRSVAEMHGCTLAEALMERTPGKAGARARRQMYLVARAMGLTLDDLCGIFGRDRKLIYEAIQADTRRVGPAETGLHHVSIPLAKVIDDIAGKVGAQG